MDIIDIILREEIEFPKMFASWVDKDDGILFYNESEKESNDSNHAILYPEKVLDMDAIIPLNGPPRDPRVFDMQCGE